MGSTTVSFHGAEFVANDTYIELWMLEVVRHIDKEKVIEEWLKDLRNEWHLQATSGFGFGVCPQLDNFLTTDMRNKKLLDLFRRSLDSLFSGSGTISAEELAQPGAGGPDAVYARSLPIQMVIEVGESFVRLLSRG